MREANTIKPLHRSVSKYDPESIFYNPSSRRCIAIAIFDASREAVEATGQIYDSTVITS